MYEKAFKRHPLKTQMVTSAFLWCGGDLAAQKIEKKTKEEPEQIDWRRSAVQAMYASVVWAPLAHRWYEVLDKMALRLAKIPKSPRFVATKVALEILALHPLSLLAFFGCVGSMNGETSTQIASQIRRDFAPTLFLQIALWTPIDVINFRFVPVRHQLLVVNCACFAESICLSYVKANGFATHH